MGKYQAGGLYGTNTQSLFRTYEPLNLKAHVPEAAKILRERYDTAVEEKSLLDRAMGSIRTISDADAAKVNAAKYDINNNIIGDRVDYENMGKTIKDAATRLLTDHSIMRAQDSFANYQKELEENAALTRQGIKILDFNQIPVKDEKGKIQKDSLGNPLMQHVSKTWDSDVNGVYQRGSQAKLDWDAQAQQLIQGIAADSGPIREALVDAGISPKEAELWLSAGEGVSKDKVKRIAQALRPVFLQTQEGMQMFNYLTRLEIDPKEGDLHRPEVAEKKMEDFLYNIGLKQAGWTNRYMQSAIDRSAGKDQTSSFDPLKLPETMSTALSELLEDKEVDKALDLIEGKTPRNFPRSAPGLVPGPTLGTTESQAKAAINTKVKRLNELYKEGRFAEAYNPSESIGTEALVEFAITNPDFAKAFPKLPNETDRAWKKRRVNVLKQGMQPYSLDLPDQEEARDLIARSLDFGGQLYQKETGNPVRTVEDAVWNESNNSQGPAFNDSGILKDELDESMRQALLNKSGSVVFIPEGKHAGKFKYHWTHDDTRYSVVIEPVAKMSAAYAPMAKINKVISSMKPNTLEEITVNIGNSRHTMEIALMAETKNGESKLVPMVRHALTGTIEISPLENIIDYLNGAVLSDMSRQNNQLGRIFRNTNLTGEKRSSMPKNE